MATKRFYATRDMKNPTNYGNRMLRAGDPVDLDGPKARLYRALGAITADKPKEAKVEPELGDLTKAELAKRAGLSDAEAKKLKKADIIAKLEAA